MHLWFKGYYIGCKEIVYKVFFLLLYKVQNNTDSCFKKGKGGREVGEEGRGGQQYLKVPSFRVVLWSAFFKVISQLSKCRNVLKLSLTFVQYVFGMFFVFGCFFFSEITVSQCPLRHFDLTLVDVFMLCSPFFVGKETYNEKKTQRSPLTELLMPSFTLYSFLWQSLLAYNSEPQITFSTLGKR